MVQFNFSFQPGVSLQQMIGFELAGQIWSKYLTDNTTINLHVGVSNDLPQNVIGGALPGFKYQQNYGEFSSALSQDATSSLDQTAIGARSGSSTYMMIEEYRNSIGFSSKTSRSIRTSNLSLTRANAKALGLSLTGDSNTLDGYILTRNAPSSTVAWSYDFLRTGLMPSNTVDFLSNALHEIGHVLGMVSGVDRPSLTSGVSTTFRSGYLAALDLFRFEAGGSDIPDLTYGGTKEFGLTSSRSPLALFATGKLTNYGGSGFQASHWTGQGSSSGLMNPTLSTGQRRNVQTLDLQALDVIGWNVASSGANTTINLPSLLLAATTTLAQRLGRDTAWLNNPLNLNAALSALSTDRMTAIATMIDLSQIYEGRRNGTSTSWQELFNIFNQEGLFETFEEAESEPLKATRGNDVIPGTTNSDQLTGRRGNDHLVGFSGSDQIMGDRGQDLLVGNLGNDALMGGKGQDYLVGGSGGDRLIGGNGADIFVVQNKPGIDQVMDFTDGQDKLLLADDLTLGQLSLMQYGQHTLISIQNHPLMLLHNVNANVITAADIV